MYEQKFKFIKLSLERTFTELLLFVPSANLQQDFFFFFFSFPTVTLGQPKTNSFLIIKTKMKLMVTIAENPRSWKTVQTNKFNI